ncbi:MAG: NAD(P)H-binding protein [Hamadaea sp.]|nr:NAD(P)H-binding protein [Hamadaea sp.]
MRITVFAATGGIGRHLVDQAIAAGHDVTAVARTPRGLPAAARVIRVDLADPDPHALKSAVDGADAVVSALGPRDPRKDVGITSLGTRHIVDAMTAAGVRRLVVVSAAPVGPVPVPGQPTPKHDPGDGFFMRHIGARIATTLFGKHYADLAVMERILRDSTLDWTVSRPPKLTDKPLTGTYRTALGHNIRGGWSVSRADTAHHMLAMLQQPQTIRQVVGVAS